MPRARKTRCRVTQEVSENPFFSNRIRNTIKGRKPGRFYVYLSQKVPDFVKFTHCYHENPQVLHARANLPFVFNHKQRISDKLLGLEPNHRRSWNVRVARGSMERSVQPRPRKNLLSQHCVFFKSMVRSAVGGCGSWRAYNVALTQQWKSPRSQLKSFETMNFLFISYSCRFYVFVRFFPLAGLSLVWALHTHQENWHPWIFCTSRWVLRVKQVQIDRHVRRNVISRCLSKHYKCLYTLSKSPSMNHDHMCVLLT